MVDVFISYSRKDTEFVRRLFDALEAQQRQSWVDWKGIDYSTKWWEEICAGIDRANNFVFVISPDALNSKYCHDEITHARKRNKRVIPFIYIDLDEEKWRRQPLTEQALENWEYLKSLQFISYPKLNDFDQAVAALVANADKDPKHVLAHTELLAAAQAWINAGKSPGFLLRDERLAQAELWLNEAKADAKDPAPTSEQQEYIAASRKLADANRTRFRQIVAATVGLVGMVILFGVASLALFGQATHSSNQAATAAVAQAQAVAAQETSFAQVSTATVEQGKAQQDAKNARTEIAGAGVTLTSVPPILTAVASALADAQIEQDISIQLSNASLRLFDKRSDIALNIMDKTVEDYPNKATAYLNRGFIYASSNQPDKAIIDYTKSIELDPNIALTYNYRGIAYSNLQQYETALADFSKALELDPNFKDAYNNRGIVFKNLHQYENALAAYNHVLELDPNSSEAYTNRGLVYEGLKQYEQAISDFNQALILDPKHIQAFTNRGKVYADLKQYDQAISDYNKALDINGDVAGIYYNRGLAYGYLQEYMKAIADYNKTLELDPNFNAVYYSRGLAYQDLQQNENAIEDYNKAIEFNPNYAYAYWARGNTYWNLSKTALAIADYRKYEELTGKLEPFMAEHIAEAEAKLTPVPIETAAK